MTPNLYDQLIKTDIATEFIDATIDANGEREFDAVGAVWYCYKVDATPVTLSLDNNFREIPLTPGAGQNFLLSGLAFKKIRIRNRSAKPATVKIYYGFAETWQNKSALESGETSLPVMVVNPAPIEVIDAALVALVTQIRDGVNKLVAGLGTVPAFTSYAALGNLATASLAVNRYATVIIDAGPAETWQLVADATNPATDIENGILKPADYNAGTNAKVWMRR